MAVEPVHLSAKGADSAREHDPLQAPLVAAFLGRTERGPLDEPVLVHSFEQFRRIFGGHRPFSFLSHTVQHYFQQGGAAAVVVRVANRATRARIEVPAAGQILHLQALQPGSRESLRVSVDYDGCEDGKRFNLVVQRLGSGSSVIEDQELYRAVSMNEADSRFIVDALQDSVLIRLVGPLPEARPDATPQAHPGSPIPYVGLTVPGSDGGELTDYDIIGSNTEGTGLFALDRVQRVDLLCIPPPPRRDLGTTTFVAAERYCRRRRSMLIWDPPWIWQSPEAALMEMRACPPESPSALGYFPRLASPEERQRFPNGVPACGAIAGMLASQPPWRRATGAAALKGGLRPLLQLQAAQAERLRAAGLNTLRRSDGAKCVLEGDRTLAGANAVVVHGRSLDRRLTVLFILGTVERWARRAAAGEGVERLMGRISRLLGALHGCGALAGLSPSRSFFVRKAGGDAQGGEVLHVGFAPERDGDFVGYEVHPGASTAMVRCGRAPAGGRRAV